MKTIIAFFIYLVLIYPEISLPETNNNSKYIIYLVKVRWHTGIVIKKSLIDTALWPESKDFKNFDCIDIGWGDKDFYMDTGFNIWLAVKALFYPTPSVLRVAAINYSIMDYINSSDASLEIKLDSTGFNHLLIYIHNSYKQNKEKKAVIISAKNNGYVKYYNAKGKYSILNTCNTWVAKGLISAGIKISAYVYLTQQLFKELANNSNVVKIE
jgi:uncharacterized protein (TIGR02117 family)